MDLDIDHVGRSILKRSELSLDRFDLLSLLLIHNTCLEDLERLGDGLHRGVALHPLIKT